MGFIFWVFKVAFNFLFYPRLSPLSDLLPPLSSVGSIPAYSQQ